MSMTEKIVSLARSRGWTQGEFERLAGLAENRISRWKNGLGEPTAAQALTMARLLGVPVDYLIDDAQAEPPPDLSREERAVLAVYHAVRLGDAHVERLAGAVGGPEPRPVEGGVFADADVATGRPASGGRRRTPSA